MKGSQDLNRLVSFSAKSPEHTKSLANGSDQWNMRQELLRKGLALHCSFLGRPFIQASLSHTSPPQLPTSVLDLFSFLDVDTTQLLFIPPSVRWVPIMYLELCQPMETQR